MLSAGNRPLLEALGTHGEVIEAPGHSHDSVSLLLDSGLAFIDDLNLPQFASDESAAALTRDSWRKLLDQGAKTFYPAHCDSFRVSVAERALHD